MKTVIYAITAQEAKRRRKPRTGETVAYRSFDDFDGQREKGFTVCEILGDDLPGETVKKIQYAYKPKTAKKDE